MPSVESQQDRKELLGLADLARILGVSAQVVQNWLMRGKLPPEDFWHGANQRPLWKRSTLKRAGLLT
jgi:hypothetical protein